MILRAGVAIALASISGTAAASPALTGVNLAGPEFGGLLGTYGKQYFYPGDAEIRAFESLGVTVFRLPVRWERIQPELDGPLDPTELARVDAVVTTATGMGISVIIDIHNYGRYRSQPLGTPAVPGSTLAALWEQLAAHYRGNRLVIFGLMNEPVRIGAGDWAAMASRALLAIRGTGATNLVLVPGTNWSGAHSWLKRVGPQSNAEALGGFVDPGHNFAFDFHQYFDTNSSGTSPLCVPAAEAERRIAVATDWLHEIGGRGFLSEFGVSALPDCQPVLRAALATMAKSPEWIGWTAWGSSAYFGRYPFNLYPLQAVSPPQLTTLRPFLANARP